MQHLGDKWPSVDFICELVDPWRGIRPFFFVQVKTTSGAKKRPDKRLPIALSKKGAERLHEYRVPVYLAGVNLKTERVYLVAATGAVASLSSMSTSSVVDASLIVSLRDDVRKFWEKIPPISGWSRMTEEKWSP